MIDAPRPAEPTGHTLPAPPLPDETSDPGAPIRRELDRFIQHINGLESTLPWSMIAIDAARDHTKEQYDAFVRDHCTIEKRRDKEYLVFDPGLRERFNKIRRRRTHIGLAGRLVPRSFIVSLVSQYDAFLGGLIRVYFALKPEALNASERSLSLAQLIEFGSIDAAKEYIIEKELESVLRKSHAEQFDWMEGKFDLPLRKDLPVWTTFIELTERRNLFVHTNGIVSSQYLAVCRKQGVECSDVKGGQELNVSPAYFTTAYEAIFEIAVKLAHVFWRKMLPADRQAADNHLQGIGYDLIVDGDYRLAATLMDFGVLTLKKHSSEQIRRVMIINRAQAYKWLSQRDICIKILEAEDWSATSDDFKMAVAVLRDDLPEVLALMRRLGDDGVMSSADYREWPLFRELRKNEEFVAAFAEIFGEPLAIPPKLESAETQIADGTDTAAGDASAESSLTDSV